MVRNVLIVIFFLTWSYSYAGGLSAWYDVKTPHGNTLDCNGGYDIDFHFTNDFYKQLGDNKSVDCCASFRKFAFCGNYLIAKGITNDKDSIFYIINEVRPEIMEFYKE